MGNWQGSSDAVSGFEGMIERISPNEPWSRVITADGNVFTEVFRAVEK